jgi:hypothetical protein
MDWNGESTDTELEVRLSDKSISKSKVNSMRTLRANYLKPSYYELIRQSSQIDAYEIMGAADMINPEDVLTRWVKCTHCNRPIHVSEEICDICDVPNKYYHLEAECYGYTIDMITNK